MYLPGLYPKDTHPGMCIFLFSSVSIRENKEDSGIEANFGGKVSRLPTWPARRRCCRVKNIVVKR